MATLASLLPAPKHQTAVEVEAPSIKTLSIAKSTVPPYRHRKGWKPTSQADFADGGSFPECHVAQYPLDLGRKRVSSNGNTLALQVDAQGKVQYDVIAQQGHRDGRKVQSQFKDLVPLQRRTDVDEDTRLMLRPSEEDVQSTTDRTKAALEKLVTGKLKAAQPKNVQNPKGDVSYLRYTASSQRGGANHDPTAQRIVKMMEVVEDPLEPSKFKGKKIPRGPPSPPAPIMRSPPRKVTAQDQKDWMIPPCVSNWKNNKGYTIPLDKRLAADGRGLQDIHINDRFASFAESLLIGERHAREEVRARAQMQQVIAQKEKEDKEEHLRMLAQHARQERNAPSTIAGKMPAALAGYGSSDSDQSSDEGEPARVAPDEEDEDEAAIEQREQMRRERRKEREREMRMNNMGTEQRARVLARAEGRDISEKVALGLAKPTLSKEAMLDSRLFNQESNSASFGDDDAYNLYDRPLFSGASAAAAIYKRGANTAEDEGLAGTSEGIESALKNDRFGLGTAAKGRGFEGSDLQEVRDGPVQFEKDTPISLQAGSSVDPFGLDAFLDEAKRGATAKRGLDTREDRDRAKRAREDQD